MLFTLLLWFLQFTAETLDSIAPPWIWLGPFRHDVSSHVPYKRGASVYLQLSSKWEEDRSWTADLVHLRTLLEFHIRHQNAIEIFVSSI